MKKVSKWFIRFAEKSEANQFSLYCSIPPFLEQGKPEGKKYKLELR